MLNIEQHRLTIATCLVAICSGALGAVEYPGPGPGAATVQRSETEVVLANEALRVVWRFDDEQLQLKEVTALGPGDASRALGRELFTLTLAGDRRLPASSFRLGAPPIVGRILAYGAARRGVERHGGIHVSARMLHEDTGAAVRWTATLRDGSNYVVQRFAIDATRDALAFRKLQLVDLDAPSAAVAGSTQGAPVTAGNLFFAYEHPMADSAVDAGHATCALTRTGTLKPGGTWTQSAAVGATPSGQQRRGFLHYVERERAHPYRPFLHYNSWYDIAWTDRKFDEAQSLAAIESFGKELIEKRGVAMDSFVFDDGWDDNRTLWQFHDGFPKGFFPLRDAAAKYNSAVGTWLSPFGGYGEPRKQRLKYAQAEGFEINPAGFSMAGPRYYARFRDICAEMIRDYGVNFFKFDGMGTGGRSTQEGGGDYIGDIEALMRLVGELRGLAPELYVSATTGTWCSPYFLWHADSIWRGAADMGFHGPGSKRQQWITYRDLHTYHNVVRQGPLYPINSLMNQGIAQAIHGPASELGDDLDEWADEVRSLFGCGTGLQELYVTPQRLGDAQWDVLADAARWARGNADIFVDTHWVGGDPAEGEVYGWASWTPRKGILVLRNPSDTAQEIAIDIANAFELPQRAPTRYALTDPWAREAVSLLLEGGVAHVFKLARFELLVYDAVPR